MFLGMQGDYIANISESREELEAIAENAGFTDIVETEEMVQKVGGDYVMGVANINEAISNLREKAYEAEVDPITAHISRLRDDDPESPEIATLMTERTAKREEIKARYPYADETEIVEA